MAHENGVEMPPDWRLFEFYDSLDNLMDINDFDKNLQNIVVFDDMITEKDQTRIKEAFIRARKQNCTLIYLSQDYTSVPREVRNNLSDIIIFGVPNNTQITNLLKNYNDFDNAAQFKQLLRACTKGHDFLYIDSRKRKKGDKYRKGFEKKTVWS